MRFRGFKSWGFGSGTDESLHMALFVRDSCNLAVPRTHAVPPRLEQPTPSVPTAFDSEQFDQAATEWPGWWDALLAHLIRMKRPHIVPKQHGQPKWQDQLAGLQAERAELARVFDPPEFEALADRPGLQSAARHAFPYWPAHDRHRYDAEAARPGWHVVRDVAEEVAARNKIRRDTLHGYATVLMVQEIWWQQIGPGVVACSANAMRDPAILRAVLTAAFESSAPSS